MTYFTSAPPYQFYLWFYLVEGSGVESGEAERWTWREGRRRRVRAWYMPNVRMEWLAAAGRLPGKASQMAQVLAFLSACQKSAMVVIESAWLEQFGIGERAAREAIRSLERAGLVLVSRATGRRPRVVLLGHRPVKEKTT